MDSTSPEEVTVALQVADSDLGPFIVDTAGQAVDEMSPLAVELGNYVPGSNRASEALAAVLDEPRAHDVAEVVACPSLKLWGRNGGGRLPVSSYAVCGRPEIHPDLFVAVSPSFEEAYFFELLDGVEEVVAWFANAFAAPVENDPPNLLPPPMALESLLYTFHAIDSFRRATLEGMLAYETTAEPAVGAEDFSTTMVRSIGSRDLRWLLPAFLHLVPNLDVGDLDIREEHIEFLVDRTLFEAASTREDGTEELVFGEAGIYLGTEFHDGWVTTAGFELSARVDGRESALARGLLAPTPLANHLVLIDMEQPKSVNHQAMSLERVIARTAELVVGAVEVAEEPQVVKEEPKASATETAGPVLIADSGERHALGLRTTVGRAMDNDLVISSGTTSGHHAVVLFDAGSSTVEDLGSSNGTWIGADRVEGRADLNDGDNLRFGEARYKVVLPAGAVAADIDDRTVALPISTDRLAPQAPLPSPPCSSCGGQVSPGAKFCGTCGKPI